LSAAENRPKVRAVSKPSVQWFGVAALFVAGFGPLGAETPKRKLPPPGVAIPAEARAELTEGVTTLDRDLAGLSGPLAPDARIFHKAVDWALRHDEFFDPKQVGTARALLAEGRRRAAALRAGQADWAGRTGLVVRAFVSALDDSVQPYGLVVPSTWGGPSDTRPRPLWIWNHGRNEKLSELAFLDERMKKAGEFVPPDAFVLHPYGRYCNATKLAGEVDVFEALAAVRAHYPIDPARLVNAGFSMGGGSAWHLAVHHPGRWVASSPGAGFCDTPIYTGLLAPGKPEPPWFQQVLWRWYDATACAGNLFNHPLLAYSGELDKQKLSSDTMLAAAARERITFERILGAKTEHKYDADSRRHILQRVGEWVRQGRDPFPREVRYTLYTLRYPTCAWVQVEGLGRHWQRADLTALQDAATHVRVTTRNITAFSLRLHSPANVTVDGRVLPAAGVNPRFRVENGRWVHAPAAPTGRVKRTGLTGPIDDAFFDRFLFVRPTGRPLHPGLAAFLEAELRFKSDLWRNLFRGEVLIKDDSAVTEEDIRRHHLVLWGDPGSNALLARVLPGLPLRWDAQTLALGEAAENPAHTVPMLIYPNPLQPDRYVVLNSGVTFRETGFGSNAHMVPMLPDWALVDLTTPPNANFPGRIAAAGFFDEAWQPSAHRPQ
jgi:dienelactone hydrolase